MASSQEPRNVSALQTDRLSASASPNLRYRSPLNSVVICAISALKLPYGRQVPRHLAFWY